MSDIDIREVIEFHKSHEKLATLTSVHPEGRYETITSTKIGQISNFVEKPKGEGAWINAGFFVMQPEVLDYITEGDATVFERGPLETLAKNGELFSIATPDSGSVWTRSGTKLCIRRCGVRVIRRGRAGRNDLRYF